MALKPAGVCGSILHVRDRCSEGEGERVWVTVRDADAKYQLLWGQFDERSGRMECLGGETEVRSCRHTAVAPTCAGTPRSWGFHY